MEPVTWANCSGAMAPQNKKADARAREIQKTVLPVFICLFSPLLSSKLRRRVIDDPILLTDLNNN